MSFNPGSSSGNIHTDGDVALSNPSNGQVLGYSSSTGKWQNQTPATAVAATTSSTGVIQLAGDLAGTATAPSVAKINGVTLPGSAPTAGNVLTATSGTATSWTTPAGGVTLDTTASDIVAGTVTGTGVAGSTGKAADAGHQHPLQAHDHTTTNKGGSIPVAGLSATGTASATTYLRGDGSWNTPSTTDATKLAIANNLSDVANASTARTNLGLGTAATQASSAFDAAGAAAAVTTTSIGAIPTSQKAAASGVASLDGTTLVPRAQLATGTSSSTTVLYGDATWRPVTPFVWTAAKTANYTAVSGDAIPVNATSGSVTITLPASPAANSIVRVKKVDPSSNSVIVTSSLSIDSNTSVTVNTQFASQDFSYSGFTWYLV